MSLTSVDGEIIEKLVREAIISHMLKNGLVSDTQYAFLWIWTSDEWAGTPGVRLIMNKLLHNSDRMHIKSFYSVFNKQVLV